MVASIGQGYVLVTPLQLAVMTARLASGTKAVTPSLQTVDGVPEFAELDISPTALRIVHKGMFEVTNGSLGTARAHNLPSRLGGMAGKTGRPARAAGPQSGRSLERLVGRVAPGLSSRRHRRGERSG